MKKVIFILLSILLSVAVFAEEEENFKHFGFSVGGGIVFSHKYNAQYYNGSDDGSTDDYRPKLSYVFENQYRRDEILLALNGWWDGSVTPPEPEGMKYKITSPIAVRFFYRFNEESRLFLEVNQLFLTAVGNFYCGLDSGANISTKPRETCAIYGSESRTMLDLGYRYNFTTRSFYDIFFELGATFTNTVCRDAQIKIRDFEASIMNRGAYDPSYQSRYDPLRKSAQGVGFFANLGAEFWVTKNFSVDIAFQIRLTDVNLGEYKKFKPQYGFLVKINLMSF
ncbi:hypothetical protein FACS1894180_7360 [Bacteroidia bacterium]|nr:hypothetical protein FACS1894180_7360 [Bacteroidia bacterium]